MTLKTNGARVVGEAKNREEYMGVRIADYPETPKNSDKIMKVARYHDHETVEEVNVSELAKNILTAGSNVAGRYAYVKDFPRFECSIGIPDFVTLEKNITDYFSKYNADCLKRFAKRETEHTAERVKNLAEKLGIAVEESKPISGVPMLE
ncbi:MAG: hypothetical protein Q7S12_01550 [bacterium]|nr:hypothetical protein [bacterium]